ncbi:MAG TPA: hypothetical protein VE360_00860 [Pyrinomonadaceae bacterium]|nr:hypothetical protein [Pyrinomonadaceae bacterium]
MQNYNAPPPGQGGYGAPPPAKKGISKGCIIGIIVAAVLAVGVVVLLVAGGLGFYFLRQNSVGGVAGPGTSNTSGGYGGTTTTTDDDDTEGPQPTAAQTAAISGGQTARWEQQEMSWTVPQRWTKQTAESTSFLWRSPGSWDAANLIVSISPMGADFPTDVSLKAFYDQAATRKQNGEVSEYQYLKLGGVKGVMFREASPEGDDNPQRLQWLGYRDYKGQKQMINIMLATRGKDFARHEDTMYGILYSTQF